MLPNSDGVAPSLLPSLERVADGRAIVPALIACLAAVGVPLLVGSILSFWSAHSGEEGSFFSFEGYRAVFSGGRVREFGHILFRSSVVTLVATALAVPSAYWISRIRAPRRRTLVFALLVTPWFVSDMLRAFGWQQLLSPAGPISQFWELCTSRGPLDGLRFNFYAAALGIVSSVLPVGILSVFAAMPNPNRSEWLAAAELGRSRHVFSLMALSWARPGIVIGVGTMFLLSCYASAEPLFLDGPTQSSVKSIAASLINAGVSPLLAFSTVLLLFLLITGASIVAIYGAVRRAKSKIDPVKYTAAELTLAPPRDIWWRRLRHRLGDTTATYAPPVAGLIAIVICCAPTVAVALEAFRQPTATGVRWTLENFSLMASSNQLLAAVTNSALLAIAVSVVVVLLSVVLSLVVWNNKLKGAALFVLALLVLLPGDAYAISLIQSTRAIFGEVEGGWAFLIVAHSMWALPIATAALVLANRHISPQVLQAGLENSRGPWEVVTRTITRINRSRLVGVVLIASTLSLNESARTAYLSGGLTTIGNEVHGRLVAGLLPENRGVFAVEFIVFSVSMMTILLQARIRGLDPSSDE